MKYLSALALLLILSCSTTSKTNTTPQYSQFSVPKPVITSKERHIEIKLINPLKCPLRFNLSSTGELLNNFLQKNSPVTLRPDSDTIIRISKIYDVSKGFSYYCMLGDLNKKIAQRKLSLPFAKGREYKILQGYNGTYSHTGGYSQYSLDIDLRVGDTVCAADDGFVVGVIKDYSEGGSDPRWKNYANFITIYHPHSGVFTQYVHLKHNGSFVKVGDVIKKGAAIGLSGITGWTNTEHLHFNALIPIDNKEGLQGIPITFEEGYTGKSLNFGVVVKK